MLNKVSYLHSNNDQFHEKADTFWEEKYPALQKYCRFLTQNKWDGDDIAQEAILKAIQHYRYKPEVSPALLNKIAYNHWIDSIRKSKKEVLGTVPENAESEDTARLAEIDGIVGTLQKYLTPKQSAIFLLKEAFQYKNSEIADILQTTEIAVKGALHRAKKRLEKSADHLKPHPSDTENDEDEHILMELFYSALKVQDPGKLIKAIPMIRSLKSEAQNPQCVFGKRTVFSNSTTSLRVAA
ncbi:sigma-70 family RNA polymerase sigma factor [Peribacillus saganii]|uniref:Sigma-70 family RNA polymerase sigma factor n=1 Tax=Peribacillus saganii TaxID=2303992 RepID=A0A372LMA9_9BACI|nr:sigma-70 family RNA polymerase sigma factor [Peribacillus saganii]RFU67671.1 sigma-70 family RNA polymerase sigma factor [Peribacillus saganii]